MSNGVFIDQTIAILGLIFGGLAYILRGWVERARKITDRRWEYYQQLSDVMFDFIDAHRENRLEDLKHSNHTFRKVQISMNLWTSSAVKRNLAAFMGVSNEFTRRLLNGQAIDGDLDKQLTTSYSNLAYAMQLEVLGYSPQGIALRFEKFRAKKASEKKEP